MAKRRIRLKNMTEAEFKSIKGIMAYKKMTLEALHQLTGRGHNTLSIIRNSKDYKDYVAKMKAHSEKKAIPAASAQPKQTEVMQSQQTVAPAAEVPSSVPTGNFYATLLSEIQQMNKNFRRMADAWETRPSKTGFLPAFKEKGK